MQRIPAAALGVLALGLIGADSSTTGTSEFASNAATPTLPTSFIAQTGSSLASLFGGCPQVNAVAGVFDGLSQVAAGGKVGAAGANGACVGSETLPDSSSLSCDAASVPGFLDSQNKLVASVEATLNCKLNQAQNLSRELSCLAAQTSALQQQATGPMNKIAADFTSNIQRYQQDMQSLKTLLGDRGAQLEDVTGKLNGNKVSGAPGLLKLQEMTKELTETEIPGKVQEMHNSQKQIDLAERAYHEQVQNVTMGLTSQCFNRKDASLSCDPVNPALKGVSPYDYALCRYYQNQHVTGGTGPDANRLKTDVGTDAMAGGEAARLKTLLDTILSRAPNSTKLPGSPEEAKASMGQAYQVLTAADVQNLYGKDLAKFNGKGLDIANFVIGRMATCFQESSGLVETMKTTRSNNDIALAKSQLEQRQADSKIASQALLAKYVRVYEQNEVGLTLSHRAMQLQGCETSPQNTISCLDDIKKNLNAQLRGAADNTRMLVAVRGTNPQNAISFSCDGLDGCVTKMTAVVDNLGREIKKLEQFKPSYALKARQEVEGYVKSKAAELNQQNSYLASRVDQLNGMLSALGVADGLRKDPISLDGAELEFDEDGIPKVPRNPLGLIASSMNPPLFDLTGRNSQGALAGLAEIVNGMNAKKAQVKQTVDQLALLTSQCATKKAGEAFDSLVSAVNGLETAYCGYHDDWCDRGGKERLERLVGDVGELQAGTGMGIKQSDIESLTSALRAGLECQQGKAKPGQQIPTATANCKTISGRIDRGISNVKSAQSGLAGPAGGAL